MSTGSSPTYVDPALELHYPPLVGPVVPRAKGRRPPPPSFDEGTASRVARASEDLPSPSLNNGAASVPGALEARVQELEVEIGDLARELERSERRVEAMKEIGRALGSSLELDSLLDEIVRLTTGLLDADRSTLFLLDGASGELWSKVLEGREHREIRLTVGAGIAGWVARSGKPLLIRDAYADARFNPDFDRRSGYRTRDILALPVKQPHRGGVIGVIQVLNKREGRFGAADERLLEAIASAIGVALEVSSLYGVALERSEALERARGELALLYETERAISSASGLAEVLEAILETAMTTLRARSGAIHVLDESGQRLETITARGPGARSLSATGGRLDEGFAGAVISTEDAIIENDLEGVKRGRTRVRSVVAVPIRSRHSGILGVLELLNADRDKARFDDGDVRTLTVVASQAGRAIMGERQRRERAQQERLSAIGQMLAGILHDFRTPMTLISGYTQVMAGIDLPSERARYADLVDRQIALLTSMTRDLLAFARGERSLLLRKVFLPKFMDEMREYLHRELEGSGVELALKVSYRGAARFDETKLRRVFHNIARNAREAMSGGGHFWVEVAAQDEALSFVFEDDGPGVPKEVEHRLFEPFATAGKVGGTGLGLAMVRQIADEHGGWVTASRRRGGGTRFELSIPLEPRA